MEDYCIDIMIGKGSSARSVRLELPKFTLVGATTRAGLLTAPLRDRFGMIHHLEFYTIEELQQIIMHSAGSWTWRSNRPEQRKWPEEAAVHRDWRTGS